MRESKFERFCTAAATLVVAAAAVFGLYLALFVPEMDNHVGLGLALAIVCGFTTVVTIVDLRMPRRRRAKRGGRR
jgi:hypothetical protein